MLRFHKTIIALAAIVVGVSAPAGASVAADSDDERSDRRVFERLGRELRQVEVNYLKVEDRAMAEARASEDGKASLETRSELIALRNQRDRLLNRMTLLALRWGWDAPMPDFERPVETEPAERERTEWEAIFEPADRILRSRFEAESREIARRIRLPVITIPDRPTQRR